MLSNFLASVKPGYFKTVVQIKLRQLLLPRLNWCFIFNFIICFLFKLRCQKIFNIFYLLEVLIFFFLVTFYGIFRLFWHVLKSFIAEIMNQFLTRRWNSGPLRPACRLSTRWITVHFAVSRSLKPQHGKKRWLAGYLLFFEYSKRDQTNRNTFIEENEGVGKLGYNWLRLPYSHASLATTALFAKR